MPGHSPVLRWGRSVGFALAGLRYAWRTQPNFRIEAVCAPLAVSAAWWLGAPLSPVLLACALVLSLELVNTALEAAVDLASPAVHPLAKAAKDAAAGAVLVASFFALLVGFAELVPRLVARLGTG